MQCPSCRATIPDGSQICPRCDAILDASFLGGEFSRPHKAPGAKEIRRTVGPGVAPPAPPAPAAPPAAHSPRVTQSRAGGPPVAPPAYPPPAAPAPYPPPAAPAPYPPPAAPAPYPPAPAPAPYPAPTSTAAGYPPPTGAHAAPAAPGAARPAAPAVAAEPLAAASDVDPEAAEQRAVGTRIVQLDPQRDMGTRIVQAPALPPELRERQAAERSRSKKSRKAQRGAEGETGGDGEKKGKLELALEESAVSRDLDAILDRVKYTFTKLDKIDRLLFYTITATFVATLLPWIYVPGEGLLSGVQDIFGAIAAAAGLLALIAFSARAWQRLRGGYLLLLELLGTFGVAAASTYRALTLTGSPYVGLYLSVVAAGVAFLLGLVRLVR